MARSKGSKKHVESVEHTLAAQVGSVAASVTTPEHKGKVTEALAKKDGDKQISVQTVMQAFSDFAEPLSPAEKKLAAETIQVISEEQQTMVNSVLKIGSVLNTLRDKIGSDSFSIFARKVLPTMGLPTSTAYKYMGKAQLGSHAVRNPIARLYLFREQGADSMFQAESNTLSDTAKKVLESMPVPAEDTSAAECEVWAKRVSKAVTTAIQKKRNADAPDPVKLTESAVNAFDRILNKSTEDTFQSAITSVWEHYLASEQYDGDTAQEIVGKLDKLLTSKAKTIAGHKSKAAQTA